MRKASRSSRMVSLALFTVRAPTSDYAAASRERDSVSLHAFRPHAEPDAFDRWWAIYPNRKAKKAARKAWERLNPSPSLVSKMMAAVLVQQKSRQWREGFIPHPATWINGERWEDELTADDFFQVKL